MGYFAKVVDGIVTNVIVAELDTLHIGDDGIGEWVETDKNTFAGVHLDPETRQPDGGVPLRKNYAFIGAIYDPIRDAFYHPQPYPSWTLNEDTCEWTPPSFPPDDGKGYIWNEETLSWVEYTGA